MKTKRLNELRATQIRVHNLEIAMVAFAGMVSKTLPPETATNVEALMNNLFEANTAARGYSAPRMIRPSVEDGGDDLEGR